MTVVAVMVAGALGAVARFVVDGAVKRRWSTTFPWATFIINVTGSLLLGLVAGVVTYHAVSADLKAIVGTGFCGGYTTFSTASFESVRLAEGRTGLLAVANVVGSVVAATAACAVGLLLAWSL